MIAGAHTHATNTLAHVVEAEAGLGEEHAPISDCLPETAIATRRGARRREPARDADATK